MLPDCDGAMLLFIELGAMLFGEDILLLPPDIELPIAG